MVIQDGSCDMQQLLNESTVVSYSGGVPPTLLTQSPVTPELFNHLAKMEETAEKLSGVFTMSRGTAPSGVRAAQALRVLEEQEDKRAYITATKYNNAALIENARMTLSVAGTYYDNSDGRLINIIGKDNEYKIMQFETASLSRPFIFRIENTTALSQSPAARIDDITDLMQMQFSPTSILTREQAIQLLDLTAADQFKDIATRAIKCAQSENDDFLAGRPVKPPTSFEDLVAHWKIHAQIFQSRNYKEVVPPERQAALEEHFLTTEYLMFEKGYGLQDSMGMPIKPGNPNFAMRLSVECPDFPLLLTTPLPLALGQMTTNAGTGGPYPQATGVITPAPVMNGANPAPPPIPGGPPPNVR